MVIKILNGFLGYVTNIKIVIGVAMIMAIISVRFTMVIGNSIKIQIVVDKNYY